MTIIRTITKNVVQRAWHDIEPKLIAFLATGLTATALVSAGDYVGVHLPDGLAALIVLIVGGIAGYVKSSTSKVIASPAAQPANLNIVSPVDPAAVAPAVVAAPVAGE